MYARLCHIWLPPVNEAWGKVMFSHLSVILFMGGVYPIACWNTPPNRTTPRRTPPLGRHPPSRHPPGQTTPFSPTCILQDTVNKRAVRILLDCILVVSVFSTSTRLLLTKTSFFSCSKGVVRLFIALSSPTWRNSIVVSYEKDQTLFLGQTYSESCNLLNILLKTRLSEH